jgi:hypothetical protein
MFYFFIFEYVALECGKDRPSKDNQSWKNMHLETDHSSQSQYVQKKR